jgi:hypothetical protein
MMDALDTTTQRAIDEAVARAIEREVPRAVRIGINAALQDHLCRFPVTDEQAQEVAHIFGMASDIGGGGPEGLSKGVERMRDNHKWLFQVRARWHKAMDILLVTILTALGGGVIAAIWAGIKTLVAGGQGAGPGSTGG